MDHTKAASVPNTQLNDRVLWYDGQSTFDPDHILDLVTKYNVQHVSHEVASIRTYNKHVPKSQEITVKTVCGPLATDWNIPNEYKTLDMLTYLADRHANLMHDVDSAEVYNREKRMVEELAKYTKFGLIDVLRTITWVINTLDRNHVVWGVGRGSSVSSYVLYVIGVHDVDSYAYDLDVDDFLHL
jgi:DNA polymerase III alpha subunit